MLWILYFISIAFVAYFILNTPFDKIFYEDIREVREDAIPIQIYSTKHPVRFSRKRASSTPDTTVVFNDGCIYRTKKSISRNGITYYTVEDSMELLGLIRQDAIAAHDKLLRKKRKLFPNE